MLCGPPRSTPPASLVHYTTLFRSSHVPDTFYSRGTVAGPDPYPRMVRDFNAVVGREARAQMLAEHGRLPDAITACVGGGSNAIGIFHAFLYDPGVPIVGAEAAGEGIARGRHARPEGRRGGKECDRTCGSRGVP